MQELKIKAARSSGSGGQHVNKVNTKVDLSFSIEESKGLSESEKKRLLSKLAKRINTRGELFLSEEGSRSQWRNRKSLEQRFINLLEEALRPEKPRSGPPKLKADRKKRLASKRRNSEKKSLRKKPSLGEY